VVVTLRPLARILPSQWQQYLQNGYCMPYLEWLDGILSKQTRGKLVLIVDEDLAAALEV
jgi:hypothetical protein